EEEEEEELEGSRRADPELFARIDGAIKSENLYANKYLQRQDIIDRFGISRHNLNNLLNTFADGQSFPSYINSIRLTEAKKLLKNKTDMNISAVAEAVGFSPANLRDQFKRRFGLTPAEYRQSL
ncbi:MAG: AraC family transcriptional regulator, partial [Bacteroidales bacterium]|nr:AraC family transcriptional regulator [Bacteroidales bacterium]MBR0083311.1 AraC family transcriptional regulator [Bacteroidales bacterium]